MDALISLVTFASPYHQAWFLISMFCLLLSCVAVKLGYRQKFQFLSVLHGVVAIEAVLWMLFRPGENEVFSVHCVWFNFLMAVVYFFLTGSKGTEAAEEAAKRREEEAAEQEKDGAAGEQ